MTDGGGTILGSKHSSKQRNMFVDVFDLRCYTRLFVSFIT